MPPPLPSLILSPTPSASHTLTGTFSILVAFWSNNSLESILYFQAFLGRCIYFPNLKIRNMLWSCQEFGCCITVSPTTLNMPGKTEIVLLQPRSIKLAPLFWRLLEALKIDLQTKVGWVLKTSGNSLIDRHWNFTIWIKGSWDNWV